MTEVELAKKFIEYFSENHEIFSEVPANGIVDFFAVVGSIRIAVEVKKSLNFKVIEQAYKNKAYATYSYAAVPFTKRGTFALKICEMLGVGVIQYRENYVRGGKMIREVVKPNINRKIYKVKLEEYMKRSVAGSQNDRVTAFQVSVENIVIYLKRNSGKAKMGEVLDNIDYHWSTISSAKGCIRQWCKIGVIKDFYIEKGYLILKNNK